MSVKSAKVLDCLGLYCPEPVFRTRIELDKIEPGEHLEVIADDPAAESDIKSLVKRLKHAIVSISKEEDSVRIVIKKLK